MSRQEIQPINAGSMADIAFLLLTFFLVTTTMDIDKGLLQMLPRANEERPPIKEIQHNKVLLIKLNDNDELMVEGEPATLADLRQEVKTFMQNGGVFKETALDERHVARKWVDRQKIEAKLGASTDTNPSDADGWRKKKNEDILDAVALFGRFKMLDKSAVIHLEHSKGASYEQYLHIQNEIDAGLNELRDALAGRYTDKKYLDLDARDPQERRLIRAIRSVYPTRKSEEER